MRKVGNFTVLDEEDGWLLLERRTINDRTIIVWYNPSTQDINLCLFNLIDQPNLLSKSAPESQWGWVTYMVGELGDANKAAEIVGYYLKDMEESRYWWEND